ncbi:aspartate aminotransferase family protein [Massilia sp. TWP1-3-3]|uniref:aspartate aminotransferase family protein n=1 Tax=Massilia sp. TWP1-3-3 TaxID=2804573 RepID=UPI003CF10FBE
MSTPGAHQAEQLAREQRHLASGISEEAQVGARVFASGSGDHLFDTEGNRYIDFAAGILTQSVGHCHPQVVAAMQEQIGKLWNVHDCATPGRAALGEMLASLMPHGLDAFCFLSTGAEAVEAAIRAVWSTAAPGRNRVGALRYGFHGKTAGARQLVHWDIGHQSFSGNSILAYSPYCYRCPLELSYPSCDLQCAKLAKRHIARDNVAAFFFEPVLGAAGVIVPPPGYWDIIGEACRAHGVLLVADEIVTGGGRAGTFLASTRLGIEPDLVTMAKGLGSGFPFAVLAGRKEIMNSPAFGAPGSSSSTFASNPLGLCAAQATLDVIVAEDLLARVLRLELRIAPQLQQLAERFEAVGEVRGLGLLYGIEFVRDKASRTPNPQAARRVFTLCLDMGLRLCLGGHILRLAPPFNVSDESVDEALAILERAIAQQQQEA